MYVREGHTNWDAVLPYVTFPYNTALQVTTEYSTYFFHYAREPLTIRNKILTYMNDNSLSDFTMDVLCRAKEAFYLPRLHTFKSQEDEHFRYNTSHANLEYSFGDEVRLSTLI